MSKNLLMKNGREPKQPIHWRPFCRVKQVKICSLPVPTSFTMKSNKLNDMKRDMKKKSQAKFVVREGG